MERVTGQAPEQPGNFVEPKIMLARNDLPIVQQEIFAPISYDIPYASQGGAIEMRNAVEHRQRQHRHLRHGDRRGPRWREGHRRRRRFGPGRLEGYMHRQTHTINWGSRLPLAQGIDFELGG